MKRWIEELSSLFFPPYCLHCKRGQSHNRPLCDSCTEQVELISPEGRCEHCFSQECNQCKKNEKRAYLFEEMDPMRSLVPSLYQLFPSPFFSLFASYLTIQLDRVFWPNFQKILPTSYLGPSRLLLSSFCQLNGHSKKALFKRKEGPILQMGIYPPSKRKSSYLLTLFP